MAAQVYSQVIPVWRALHRLLAAATWPAPPDSTKGIIPAHVFLSGYGKDGEPLENVLVGTRSAVPAGQEWATTGLTRDEKFLTKFAIHTSLTKRTEVQALDRIESLVQVAESVILTAMRQGNKPPEIATNAWWWGISSIDQAVGQLDAAGFGGSAIFTIAVQARIGGY